MARRTKRTQVHRIAARIDEATAAKLHRMAHRRGQKGEGTLSGVIRALVMAAPEDMIVEAQPMSNRDAVSLEAQRVAVAN